MKTAIFILTLLFCENIYGQHEIVYSTNISRSLSPWHTLCVKKGTLILTKEGVLTFTTDKGIPQYDFKINIDSIKSIEKSGMFMFFYTKAIWPNMVSILLNNESEVIRFYCWRRKKFIETLESKIREIK